MLRGVGRIARRNILLGLVLVTPLVVTIYIVQLLFAFITGNHFFSVLIKVLPKSLQESDTGSVLAHIFALLLVLVLLFFVGFAVRGFLGRRLYRFGEIIIERIPIFNKIYIWVRQISEAFLTQRQTLFKEVVLMEYPRKGLYSIAFVTAPATPSFHDVLPDGTELEYVSLFIPTTPNPTSGLMIVAPRRDLKTLAISIPDAMKLIVSAGAVYPGTELVDHRPTFLDKLEGWFSKEPRTRGSASTPKESS